MIPPPPTALATPSNRLLRRVSEAKTNRSRTFYFFQRKHSLMWLGGWRSPSPPIVQSPAPLTQPTAVVPPPPPTVFAFFLTGLCFCERVLNGGLRYSYGGWIFRRFCNCPVPPPPRPPPPTFLRFPLFLLFPLLPPPPTVFVFFLPKSRGGPRYPPYHSAEVCSPVPQVWRPAT